MGRPKILSLIILLIVVSVELYFIAWLWGFGRVGRVYTNNYMNPAFLQFGNFNILGVSKQRLLNQMEQYDPDLVDVEITKKLNGDIHIDVKQREEKYILVDIEEKHFYTADSRGVVTGEAQDQDKLTIVTGKVSLKPGTKMDSKTEQAALALADNLKDYQTLLEQEKIVIQDDGLSLVFMEGVVVILPITEETDPYLQSLQILLERFTIEGRLPQEIDLRFSRPVVKM